MLSHITLWLVAKTKPNTDAELDTLCFPVLQLYEDSESPSAGGTTQDSRHFGRVSPQEFCHRDFGRLNIIFCKEVMICVVMDLGWTHIRPVLDIMLILSLFLCVLYRMPSVLSESPSPVLCTSHC